VQFCEFLAGVGEGLEVGGEGMRGSSRLRLAARSGAVFGGCGGGRERLQGIAARRHLLSVNVAGPADPERFRVSRVAPAR